MAWTAVEGGRGVRVAGAEALTDDVERWGGREYDR